MARMGVCVDPKDPINLGKEGLDLICPSTRFSNKMSGGSLEKVQRKGREVRKCCDVYKRFSTHSVVGGLTDYFCVDHHVVSRRGLRTLFKASQHSLYAGISDRGLVVKKSPQRWEVNRGVNPVGYVLCGVGQRRCVFSRPS